MVFHISWIFCIKLLLDLMFSWTDWSISSILSSVLEILSSLSFILLFMFALWFLIVLSWFLFLQFLLLVFSLLSLFQFSSLEYFLSYVSLLFPLRDLLMSSNFLFVFFAISLRNFFISSLRASNILLKLFFRSFSSASSMFGCSSLGVVGLINFTSVVVFLVMFHMLLPCILILFSNWCSCGCLWLWWSVFQVLVDSRLRWLLLCCSQCHGFSHPVGHSVFLGIAEHSQC